MKCIKVKKTAEILNGLCEVIPVHENNLETMAGKEKLAKNPSFASALTFRKTWSGRADSNCRPPAPKAGALTRLRYAPLIQDN